jgi:fibronectin-binding autotransporter adhesin
VLAACASVQAAVWTNSAGGGWGEPLNWSGGIPDAIGAVADFGTLDITSDLTVSLDASRAVGHAIFGDTAASHNWTLGTGGASITFQSAGSPGAATGNATLQVNNTTLTFGPTTPLFNPTGQTLYFTGPGRIVMSSTGTASGSAATGSGKIYITNGVTVAVGIGGGNLAMLSTTPGSVVADNITIDGGTLEYGGAGVNQSANRGYRLGPAVGAGGGTINTTSGSGSFSLPGIWANNGTGIGGLNKVGIGSFSINANNTYSGPTAIYGGFLLTNNLKDGGVNSGIGNSGSQSSNLILDGGTLRYVGGNQATNRLFSIGVAGGSLEANTTAGSSLNFSNSGAIAFTGAATPRTFTLGSTQDTANTLTPLLSDNTAAGTTSLTKEGSGRWVLAGNNTYTGTTTINSGTLQVGAGGTSGTLGSGPIMNNAALAFNRSDAVTFGAAIQGGGSVTKLGPSLLTLSGASTYTGDTNVDGGVLSITGSLASTGNVNVNSGGVLTGTGTVRQVSVKNGGILTAGADGTTSSTGALNIPETLSMEGNGTLRFDITGTGAGQFDTITVNNVNFDGSSVIVVPLTAPAGSYTLLTATSSFNGTPLLNAPTGTRKTFTPHFNEGGNGLFTLDVGSGTPKTLTWRGTAGTAWDINGLTNWTDNGGVANEKYFNLDTVIFDGTGSSPTVELNVGAVPTAVTVDGSYTFNGSGSISGTTGITKTGSGSLFINLDNRYTGTTFVQNGTIVLGHDNAIGTGTSSLHVSNSPGTTARVDLNGRTATVTSLVTQGSGTVGIIASSNGSSTLRVNGPGIASQYEGLMQDNFGVGAHTVSLNVQAGTLTLTQNHTYTGDTTIDSAGALIVGTGGATGAIASNNINNNTGYLTFNRTGTTVIQNLNGDGTLTIAQGTLQAGTGSGTSFNAGRIDNNGVLVLNTTSDINISGGLTGTGSVIKNQANTVNVTGAGGNMSGGWTINAGRVFSGAANAIGTGPVVVNNASTIVLQSGHAVSLTFSNGGTVGFANDLTNAGEATFATGTTTNVTLFNTGSGTSTSGAGTFTGAIHGAGTINVIANPALVTPGTLDVDGADAFRPLAPTTDYSGVIVLNPGVKGEVVTTAGGISSIGTGRFIMTAGTFNNTGTRQGDFTLLNVRNLSTGDSVLGNDVEVVAGTGSFVTLNALDSTGPAGNVQMLGNLKVGSLTVGANKNGANANIVGFQSVTLTAGATGPTVFSPATPGYTSGNTAVLLLNAIGESAAGSSWTMAGNSQLILTGNHTYTGAATVSSGNLQLGRGSLGTSIGSTAGITNDATVVFNSTGAVSVSGGISGAGTVLHLGGGSSTVAGEISATNGVFVNAGSLTAARFAGGMLAVAGGARADVSTKGTPNSASGTSVVQNLSIATGGVLNLANNSAIVDYNDVGTLVDDTRQHLAGGRIISTSATGLVGLGYADNAALDSVKTGFGGQTVDATSLLIKFTYFGDTDLDGDVDVADLGKLATNWQQVNVWAGGDFDYNASVDVNDLGLLATNWQAGVGNPLGPTLNEALASLGLPSAAVPEPAAMSLMGVLSAWSLKRPRRRR